MGEAEEERAREREIELASQKVRETQGRDDTGDATGSKPAKEKKQKKVKKVEKWMVDRTEKMGKDADKGPSAGPGGRGDSSSSKVIKDGLSVDQWNDVRKELGMKPLKG